MGLYILRLGLLLQQSSQGVSVFLLISCITPSHCYRRAAQQAAECRNCTLRTVQMLLRAGGKRKSGCSRWVTAV